MKRTFKSLAKRAIPRKYMPQVMKIYTKCIYYALPVICIGNQFECPFCGRRFRKLLPYGFDYPVKVIGAGYRLNAKCPRCSSFDRERLIYVYLKNKTNLFCKNQNSKILHVAPETNLQRVLLSFSNIHYVSADLAFPAMVKTDVTHIGLKDNAFDAILCSHVLEHVPNDLKAMSELFRVLKPGGWAICQVPISPLLDRTYEDPTITNPEERVRQFGDSYHVRIYARDYKDRLESVGFSVEVYNFAKEFGQSTAHKYGLIKEEDIYICSKPNQEV